LDAAHRTCPHVLDVLLVSTDVLIVVPLLIHRLILQQGEEQKKLDVISNDIFCNCLRNSGRTGVIASEEEATPVAVEETDSGNYIVVFDPLDGSSNIDAGQLADVWSDWGVRAGGGFSLRQGDSCLDLLLGAGYPPLQLGSQKVPYLSTMHSSTFAPGLA
jgi:hypothetical protein